MWPNPDLVTFTEEIFNGKLHFLCSVVYWHNFIACILTHSTLFELSLAVLGAQWTTSSGGGNLQGGVGEKDLSYIKLYQPYFKYPNGLKFGMCDL